LIPHVILSVGITPVGIVPVGIIPVGTVPYVTQSSIDAGCQKKFHNSTPNTENSFQGALLPAKQPSMGIADQNTPLNNFSTV
jgi:hypothetical protein